MIAFFFFQAEDGIRDVAVTGVQTCALPISAEPIVNGQRNDTLYRLARALRARGLTPQAIKAAVEAENGARCMPPLEAQELAGLITHALAQPDRDDFAAAGATLTVPVVPPIAGGSGPVVADEALTVQLSTIEPESIEWLWPGRIPQRKLTLFCGDAGGGKSFLTLDIAARTTMGMSSPGST